MSTPDPDKTRKAEEERKRLLQYHGYSPALVKRFCDMGFEVPVVVSAFEQCRVAKHNGEDYSLSNEQVAEVTSRLFGD